MWIISNDVVYNNIEIYNVGVILKGRELTYALFACFSIYETYFYDLANLPIQNLFVKLGPNF